MEDSDVLISAGGVLFNDFFTAAFDANIDPDKFFHIDMDFTRIGDRVYTNVRLGDVLRELTGEVKKLDGVEFVNPGLSELVARCYPVTIDGRIGARIVLPELAGYSPIQIEVIAATGTRDALDIDDSDSLRLEIHQRGVFQCLGTYSVLDAVGDRSWGHPSPISIDALSPGC